MSSLKDMTIIFLICHFLGDFQLQTEILARKKEVSIRHFWAHILIHAVLLLIPIGFGIANNKTIQVLIASLIIIAIHTITDYTKIELGKRFRNKESLLFILDQIIHIATTLIVVEVVYSKALSMTNLFILERLHLNWLLLLVLITKPANIVFKIVFSRYEVEKKPDDTTEAGAGALIGTLERVLSIIFLAINSIAAIGLIYTAKSIARFKQIEENRRFAEYYLIGTLYSILYALVSYHLVLVI